MPLTYKKANRTDIPKLVDIDKKAFNRDFDNPMSAEEFEKYMFSKPGETGFIYNNETCVGYYSWVDIDDDTTEIVAIAILPEYQRKTFGSKGIQMMLDKLRHKSKLKIVTHPKNLVALKVYMNNGFIISGYSEDYYGPDQPRVILYCMHK